MEERERKIHDLFRNLQGRYVIEFQAHITVNRLALIEEDQEVDQFIGEAK